MPVRKVKGGYKWGKSGHVYPTKKQAALKEELSLLQVGKVIRSQQIRNSYGL